LINTDVWASMGQEEQAAERIKCFQGFQLKQNSSFSGQARLLGPALPAGPRGEEITDEVLEGPHSAVFDQAENKLHVHKACWSF